MNKAAANKFSAKKYVRYTDGADLFCMSQSKFQREARRSGAVYKLDKLVLVDVEEFDKYIKAHRLPVYDY